MLVYSTAKLFALVVGDGPSGESGGNYAAGDHECLTQFRVPHFLGAVLHGMDPLLKEVLLRGGNVHVVVHDFNVLVVASI